MAWIVDAAEKGAICPHSEIKDLSESEVVEFQWLWSDSFFNPTLRQHTTRIAGRTAQGVPVVAHVHGMEHYFYCSAWFGTMPKSEAARRVLSAQLRNALPAEMVKTVELVLRTPVYEYYPEPIPVFKITVTKSSFVSKLRAQLTETGIDLDDNRTGSRWVQRQWEYSPNDSLVKQVFPSTQPGPGHGGRVRLLTFDARRTVGERTAIDRDLGGGMHWLRVRQEDINYRINSPDNDDIVECLPKSPTTTKPFRVSGLDAFERSSWNAIEFNVSADKITLAPDDDDRGDAPFTLLSFDIEVKGREGHFPQPDEDPVIAISAWIKRTDKLTADCSPDLTAVFSLGTCSPIPNVEVYTFDDERDLMDAFADFVNACDPDVLTGHNVHSFDIRYLVHRAYHLDMPTFAWKLSRFSDPADIALVKPMRFQSKQGKVREGHQADIPGRVVLDEMLVIQDLYNLDSVSLNYVAERFLNLRKNDVHYSEISRLHEGTPDDRQRLCLYCVRDSELPARIVAQQLLWNLTTQLARLTMLDPSAVLNRGQMIRWNMTLARDAFAEDGIMPDIPPRDAPKYTGATVLEPKPGLYDYVATLDFASLYPSIILSQNIDYGTFLPGGRNQALRLGFNPDRDCNVSPGGKWFLKKELKQGHASTALRRMLDARKRAKDLKKAALKAGDVAMANTYESLQLAIKVVCNSLYGYYGGIMHRNQALARSITDWGRASLEMTKRAIEEHFRPGNFDSKGRPFTAQAVVVYGDTDSVMPMFDPDLLKGVKRDLTPGSEFMRRMQIIWDWGEEASALASKLFGEPMKLEFEKVCCPFVIFKKKMYAFEKWTNLKQEPVFEVKGLPTVRRDRAPFLRDLVRDVAKRMCTQYVDSSMAQVAEYAFGKLKALAQGEVRLDQLIIRKTLKCRPDEYDSPPPHIKLVQKLEKRDPGAAPKVGDKVEYVCVRPLGVLLKNCKVNEMFEEPLYAIEKGLTLNWEWYLNNHVKKPLSMMMQIALEHAVASGAKDEITTKWVGDVWQKGTVAACVASKFDVLTRLTGVGNQTTLGSAAGNDRGKGFMDAFCVKKRRCMQCRSPIDSKGHKAVCSGCADALPELFMRATARAREAARLSTAVMQECFRCAKQDADRCSNRDCKLFYERLLLPATTIAYETEVKDVQADMSLLAW